jgi:hypothetical protein
MRIAIFLGRTLELRARRVYIVTKGGIYIFEGILQNAEIIPLVATKEVIAVDVTEVFGLKSSL